MFIQNYVEWVIKHRLRVLTGAALVTLVALCILSQGVFASSLLQLFFGESDDYDRYRELANEFSASDVIVLVIDDEALFEPRGWQALSTAVAGIEELEDVRRVTTLQDGNLIEAREGALHIANYRAEANRPNANFADIKEWVTTDPLLSGTLVSTDARAYTMVVELTDIEARPVEDLPEILGAVLNLVHAMGIEPAQVHQAGFVPDSVEATVQARLSIILIFPVTTLILICVVYWLFGQLWPVFATAGVGLVAITWTFAIAILVDPQINLMLAMVPAVMMVVSFSDIVHLCSCYILELSAGLPRDRAIVKSCSEVGVACWYTSITTFFGFVAMAFVPTPVFRLLGVILGLGVAIALVLAITLVPIFFSFLRTPDIPKESSLKLGSKIVTRITHGCARVGTGAPKTVIAIFLVFITLSFFGIANIQVETNLQERLSPNNHIRQAQEFIQARFSGTNMLDIYMSAKRADAERLLTPKHLENLYRAQVELEALEEIDSVHSIVDLLLNLHREMTGDSDAGLPKSQALISQYLMLFEMSGGEGLQSLIRDDQSLLRLTARVARADLVRSGDLGDDIAEVFRHHLGDSIKVEVTGMSYLMGKWIAFIVEGQKRGLYFAICVTALMMWICLRSFLPALISMIPNLLPIVSMGGLLGLTQDSVDSDTMVVAMIAIGIAVDDTIHFLTRYKMEAARSATTEEAIERTFEYTGRGIVKTTLILCLGLVPFVLSDYLTTQMMGTLLPMTLVVALVADLLLLPALIQIRILRFDLATPEVSEHAA